MSAERNICMLIHGGPKVGKTTLGASTPAPRLILDGEGGTRFLPQAKVIWNPITESPPTDDGSWETCIVYVRSYQDVDRAYQWLASGQHPFRSVTLDSVSEIQQRCIDAIAGSNQMKTQDWGELLRSMSLLLRQFRDLTFHPTNALDAVVLVAMGREQEGKYKPFVQGSLAVVMPYYVDVLGYMFTQPNETGELAHRLLVSPHPSYEAGDRTGRLPGIVDEPLTVTGILDLVFGPSNNGQKG